MDVLTEVNHLLNDTNIVFIEQVQSLWSGYGQIMRCRSLSTGQSYIVKAISLRSAGNHPRGWNTQASHMRKVKSYQIEAAFYQQYAALTDSNNKVPTLFTSQVTANDILLVMEDLDQLGYNERKTIANWPELAAAIRWLAYFHARFMGICSDNPDYNLWPIGTYWHLATRQDELAAMPQSEFKTHACAIDERLHQAQFQTLLHGDAKFENMCFSPDNKTQSEEGYHVAAIDFQYIGVGSGVKDLAYLVGSCLHDPQLFEYDDLVVDEYLLQLEQALTFYNKPINIEQLKAETKKLYPIAWADFYRFLLGWNPKSWKIGDYIKHKAALGLSQLS